MNNKRAHIGNGDHVFSVILGHYFLCVLATVSRKHIGPMLPGWPGSDLLFAEPVSVTVAQDRRHLESKPLGYKWSPMLPLWFLPGRTIGTLLGGPSGFHWSGGV